MPGLPLAVYRFAWMLGCLLVVAAWVARAGARSPNLAKYPLRVHVLASDETHKTPRMSPAEGLACDEIGGMMDSISPSQGGPISLSGISSDPCSLHPEVVAGRLLNVGDEEPVYSGEARGDLGHGHDVRREQEKNW